MAMTPILYLLAAPFMIQSDSARLLDGRVVVEPLGVSVAIPPSWLGLPDPQVTRPLPCLRSGETVFTAASELQRLTATSNWANRHFATLLDSSTSARDLVAHVGGAHWIDQCGNGPFVRIYVTQASEDSVHAKVRRDRIPFADDQLIRMLWVRTASRDSAGWRITRVEWNDTRSDASYGFHVDFISRRLKGRTLLFALMSIGTRNDPQMWEVFRSVVMN